MFTVVNCGHAHGTVEEAKICLGLIRTEPVRPYASQPTRTLPFRDRPDSMSASQESYLRQLGATDRHLFDAHRVRISMNQASKLIDNIKSGRVTVSPQPTYQAQKYDGDMRVTTIKAMFSIVPSGYFAVRADSNEPLTFMRVSRPKSGQYKGTVKVQTQHGDRLEVRAAGWPSGQWSFYSEFIIDKMMLLIADYKGAAMTYAREIGKCCRCNAELTDERSRHYGIGPECETHWPWVIEERDLADEMKEETVR